MTDYKYQIRDHITNKLLEEVNSKIELVQFLKDHDPAGLVVLRLKSLTNEVRLISTASHWLREQVPDSAK